MRRWERLTATSAIIFYLLIALEVVLMITPFSVYFYSLYAPILNGLERSPKTAWLTAFFLPHISYSGDPFLATLAYLGPILIAIGLIIFFICALQVYSAKLLKRGVVKGGLYSYIRHPQYLGFSIAGLGLLLYWPRFLILIAFVSMLFIYYILARNEEWRMERKHGDSYREYMRRIPGMFLPGNPGGKLFVWITGGTQRRGLALALLYLAVLGGGIGTAFALREYSKARVPIFFDQGLMAISTSPVGGDLDRIAKATLRSEQVSPLLNRFHREGHTIVAYIFPREYMMQHIIADVGEHEAHHGKADESGLWPTMRHLAEMYALKPMRQLRDGRASSDKRVIFTEAKTPFGEDVPVERALSVDVLRYPLFLAEVDAKEGKVNLTMELPKRHAWGNIPVPAF